jgi:hypothetical protein
MEISVDLASDSGPTLLAPADFRSFKVSIHGGDDREQAARALSGVADWADDGHVAVSPEAVRRLAGDVAASPDWEDGFGTMLAYAQAQGWIVGAAIRAHVEWR